MLFYVITLTQICFNLFKEEIECVEISMERLVLLETFTEALYKRSYIPGSEEIALESRFPQPDTPERLR